MYLFINYKIITTKMSCKSCSKPRSSSYSSSGQPQVRMMNLNSASDMRESSYMYDGPLNKYPIGSGLNPGAKRYYLKKLQQHGPYKAIPDKQYGQSYNYWAPPLQNNLLYEPPGVPARDDLLAYYGGNPTMKKCIEFKPAACITAMPCDEKFLNTVLPDGNTIRYYLLRNRVASDQTNKLPYYSSDQSIMWTTPNDYKY